ncbi:MAG: sulfatase, partial [Myxococcota bacterium]
MARSIEQPQVAVDPRPPGDVGDLLALSRRDDVNVLFVLIDTLRADRLSVYGHGRRTSPVLDALASEGIRFARHLAQSSWTKSSMASLWTGLYPAHAGVTRFDDRLAGEAKHAAEIFREAGFFTAGLWRNGWVEGYFGFDQGFEVYARPSPGPIATEVQRENPTIHVGGSDLDLVAGAREFLRVHGRERWLLYLHLMDVHEYVYDETTAVFGSGNADVYDNAILRTNQVLNVLFTVLYETGHLINTLVVIGSDHGEAFGERGIEGHARNVYPETTEVPLIIGLPFRLASPVVVRQRTENVDLWPTVLDLLGLPPLEAADGRSRVPEILAAARGEPASADESVAIAHLDQTWGHRVE